MSDFSSLGQARGVAVASPPDPPAYPEITGSPDEWLRSLSWREFEDLVGRAYRFQGYEVLPTAAGADGGIDLILTRSSERIFVQCKHWRSQQVGVKVVRELYGLVAAHGATWGIVATSGAFTDEAEEFARNTRTTLLDGRAVAQLVALARDVDPVEGPPLTQASPVPAPANLHIDPSCPICSAPMALRIARRGARAGSRFWGCTRFPGCKGVRPAPQAAARPRPSAGKRVVINLVGLTLSTAVVVGGIFIGGRIAANTITGSINPPAAQAAGGATFGDQPVDVAYDATAKVVYSANVGSGDVTAADATSLAPARTINVAGKPVAVANDATKHLLYVADGAAKKVYVVDTRKDRTVATLTTLATPSDLAVDPARQRLYVVSKSGNVLESFNTATRARVGSRTVPGHPNAIALNATTNELYIAAQSITVRSGFTLNSLQTLSLRGEVEGLAVDSARNRMYLTRGKTVEEYHLNTHATRRFSVDAAGGGVAVDPAKRRVYLAVPGQDTAVAISVK